MKVTRALKILIALGLMALLWAGVDGPAAAAMLARADPRWLLAALATLSLQTLLSAWRWRLTAARLGIEITPRRAVREYWLAQVVNQSLPGGVAGDVGRAVRSREGAGLGRAVHAVMIERLSGQVAMITLMLAGTASVTLLPGGIDLPRPVLGLVLIIALIAVAIVAALAVIPHLAGLRADVARALLARGAWPRQAALSAAAAGLNLLSFDFCARATGTDLPASAVMALVPLILGTMILPVTIAGWGLREGAAAALFPIAGASGAAGLAASVAFGVMFLVSTLPGVIVLLTRRRDRSQVT